MRDPIRSPDGGYDFPSFERSSTEKDPVMDIIFINGLRGETVIGIHESELYHPQPVCIDLAMGLPRSASCCTDRIEDTIDYGEVRSAIQVMFREHSCDLLEAFAEQLAQMILGDFGAHWVRVTVTKPHKFDDVDGVGVTIERVRVRHTTPPRRDGEIFRVMGGGLIPGAPPAA